MREVQTQDCSRFQAELPDVILGSLESDEANAVLEHAANCSECRDMLKESAAVVSQALLSDIDLDVEVAVSVKKRLMQGIREAAPENTAVRLDRDGLLILRSTKVPWRETGMPGMQWRPLSSSRYDDRTMALFRLNAGATVPQHRHDGMEELYLLSGTLLVEGVTMNPGDYCRGEFGSMHAPVVALTNAEFLLCAGNNTFL